MWIKFVIVLNVGLQIPCLYGFVIVPHPSVTTEKDDKQSTEVSNTSRSLNNGFSSYKEKKRWATQSMQTVH